MRPVSLYIPCYNVERFIARCIEGVLAQTHAPDEILIIDDGCKDATLKVASKYPVRIIQHPTNKGLSAARNTGFREARNELVAALDADCVPDRTWLECLIRNFDDDAASAAGGKLVETVLDSTADRWRKAHMSQDWGPERTVNPPFMFGNNSIIRKSVVEKVGWYDERLRTNAEDFDLCQRMRLGGFGFVYDPAAIVSHLRQDTTRSILDTFWRYGRFDYFKQVTTIETLKRIRHQICRTSPKLMMKDWKAGRYELLGLDAALPLYTTYRDLQLLIQSSSSATPTKSEPEATKTLAGH